MKKHIFFLFILLILCYACKEQHANINDFNIVKKIVEYDSIYSDINDEIVGIMGINKYKNFLISYNRSSANFLSFYDIEKGFLLGSWGSRGQGPDDFINPSEISIIDSQLVFTHHVKQELVYVPIEPILNKEENKNIKRESYSSTGDFRPLRLEIINDKKIALGFFTNNRFGVLDKDNNIVDCPSDYPFNYEEVTGIYRGLVFQYKIKSNIKQSKFVISTNCSDIFEIFQITDIGIDRIFLNSFKHIPKIMETPGRNSGYDVDRRNSIGGLVNMAVTDDLIYFMYTSKSYDESARSGHLLNEILCFNWNGEKIKKYILPFPIKAISFCADNEFFYGVREFENETVIYRFKMI